MLRFTWQMLGIAIAVLVVLVIAFLAYSLLGVLGVGTAQHGGERTYTCSTEIVRVYGDYTRVSQGPCVYETRGREVCWDVNFRPWFPVPIPPYHLLRHR